MKHARIYQPAKSAMQSGVAHANEWRVETVPESAPFIEPIMGWVGSEDMYRQQVIRSFSLKEGAIKFAERSGFTYEVIEPQKASIKIKSYSDNFKYRAT